MCELEGCPPEVLDHADGVVQALRDGAKRGSLRAEVYATDTADGFLAVLVGDQACVVAKTWPSLGRAMVDVIATVHTDCGALLEPVLGTLRPSAHVQLELGRGAVSLGSS